MEQEQQFWLAKSCFLVFVLKMGRVSIIYLREVAIVKSGHDEWKTKSAVEEVGEGQMENQDCFACLQLRDSIWVPDALF